MKLSKKILKSRAFQSFVCWLAHKYIMFTYYTCRWDIRGMEHRIAMENLGKPFIIAFWHGRLLMIPPLAPKVKNINVLISNHNDGQLIAQTMTHFKYKLIRGSTGKDGMVAFRQILKANKNGEVVAITPDGPKGPRMRVSGSIIKIAQMTGAPILPMTFSSNKCKILRSWDSFIAAKPFGKCCFIFGEPMKVDRKLDDEQLEKAGIDLENRLNLITKQADEAMGLKPVEPSDESKEKRSK